MLFEDKMQMCYSVVRHHKLYMAENVPNIAVGAHHAIICNCDFENPNKNLSIIASIYIFKRCPIKD